MTADAKIGLLLALIFIVAIAFVINGLPIFNKSAQQDEPQKDYFSKYKNPEPGLVGSARKVAPSLNRTFSFKRTTTPEPKVQDTVRYKAILPKADKIVKTTSDKPEPLEVVFIPVAPKDVPVAISPKKYIVQKGDSLAGIAKKFYGDESGNKLANVENILKANSKILKSINELSIGQKLIIPSLVSSETSIKKQSSVIDDDSSKSTEFLEYTVEEDDNLWYIAEKFLGNGARYKEIAKLNSSIIKDENNLTVGMRLRLPKRQ